MNPTRRALFWSIPLILAAMVTPAEAQSGKVSASGNYLATLTCGGGSADVPGPNGESYTSAGVLVWDTAGVQLSRPSVTCGQTVAIGGAGASTLRWFIFVFDKAYTLVKQCESEPDTRIGAARFACKASGNVGATLTIKPQ